jgi:hypothetical protein
MNPIRTLTTDEKLELLDKELDTLTEEVLELRRGHRADLGGMRLEIEAIKLYEAERHPDFERRFSELRRQADREIAPERANPEFYVHEWEDKLNPDELRQLHVEDVGLLVRDIMTARVYTVAADATVAQVASTMVEGHVHRLLVADGDRLVGIVSTIDLLRAIAGAGAAH